MKKRKAFTLVEILVSLAILGILTISFLTIITNNFLITDKTRDLTKTTFQIQKSIEEKIDDLKVFLVEDNIPPPELYNSGNINIWSNLKTGGIIVKYYEVSESNSNKVYATIVSDVKPKVFEPISIESINLKVDKLPKTGMIYGYCDQSIVALGEFKNDEAYRYQHLTNIIEWHVSDKKFIMPIPNDEVVKGEIIEDIHEVVLHYPMFPRDYLVVKNERIDDFGEGDSKITDLKDYKGQHLVFTVTPGAKSGRIGNQMVSDSIFISGLPTTTNLEMHFDANFIDSYNSNELSETNLNDENILLVDKWYNLYSIITSPNVNKPDEFASSLLNNTNSPRLIKEPIYNGYRGQYVKFEYGSSLNISKVVSNLTQNFTFFIVARNNESNSNPVIVKNNNYDDDDENKHITIPENNNKWQLIINPLENNSINLNLVFGNADVDIAEIVVYRGNIGQEDSISKEVTKYLKAKYDL